MKLNWYNTLIITNIDVNNEGDYYCVVTGDCGNIINSNTSTLTTNSIPSTGNIIGNTNPEPLSTYTYLVSNNIGSSYNWIVEGGAIITNNGNSIDVMWGNNGFGSLCVVETNENNCSGDTICLEVTVFVDQINLFDNINIYPNPTQNIVNIDFAGLQDVNLTISDITGKIVYQKTDINESVYSFEFAEKTGIYFIQIKSNENVQIYKLIKK